MRWTTMKSLVQALMMTSFTHLVTSQGNRPIFAQRAPQEESLSSVSVLRSIATAPERQAFVFHRARIGNRERIGNGRIAESARRSANEIDEAIRQALQEDTQSGIPLRPNLLQGGVNPRAQLISRAGAIFTSNSLNTAGVSARDEMTFVEGEVCPFREVIDCDLSAKYRTADGSCNNLANPLWGRANTPFGRFLPPQYGDELNSPRFQDIRGNELPLARLVSTQVHSASSGNDIHHDITHMTMEFGQFVSHDINSNTPSTGLNGSALVCCKTDGSIDDSPAKRKLGCFPIEIPDDDPYFSQFSKRCMNFARAAATPDINCDNGLREQLNQVTHFIDGSTVYGSDEQTMADLRQFTDGLLKVTTSPHGELLPQNPSATGTPACVNTGSFHCFKTGEKRSNQQPALMTLHTIFMREHNRVARALKSFNPSWDDEQLFQEARKIVGAEIQHVTYSHYLPTIMGETLAGNFGFRPQASGSYFTEYNDAYMPTIRNSFAAAAYRFAHSTARDRVAPGMFFKDHFLNPQSLYIISKGPSFITQSLLDVNQQKTDRLMSSQLTNHLLERTNGSGLDLASINIQRGRDHGLGGYNLWRDWCGLPVASSFGVEQGGLNDHSPRVADALRSVYHHPDDIDLWTGIVSEMPLEGRAVGPTGACLIGRQFWIMKHADRFYYETNNPDVKFEIEQLDEIRKTTLARIICDNTDVDFLQRNVFREESNLINPMMDCSTLEAVDLSKWTGCRDEGWSEWSAFTSCRGGKRTRRRFCRNECAACEGRSTQIRNCGGGGHGWFMSGK